VTEKHSKVPVLQFPIEMKEYNYSTGEQMKSGTCVLKSIIVSFLVGILYPV